MAKNSSNLGKLGVCKKDVGRIHNILSLKHDTEFELIPTKGAAKEALKCGAFIVAVKEGGGAKAMTTTYTDYGNGTRIRLAGSEACCGYNSLTGAWQSIAGKGWTLYKALPNNNPGRPFYSKEDSRDYLEEFDKAIDKYEPKIKAEAKEAAKKIKSFLVRTINDLDNKGEGFVKEKEYYRIVRDIAKKGTEGYDEGGQWSSQHCRSGLIYKYFHAVGATGGYSRYVTSNQAKDLLEEDPLAVPRFVKEVLHMIRNIPTEYRTDRRWGNQLQFDIDKEEE